VAAVVAGALVLAGGAGALLLTRHRAPSKAQYISRADAVCRPANAAVTALGTPTSYPELSAAAGTVATSTRTQVDQLKQLRRPGGSDRGRVDAMVTSLDGTGVAAQRLHDAASGADDAGTVSATKDLRDSYDHADTAAATFGFTACATGMKAGTDATVGGSHAVVKSAFVAKAEAACRTAARDMDAVPEPRGGSGAEVARTVGAVMAIADRTLTTIRALPVPPGDETTVADMLGAQEKVNAKGHDAEAAARAEDGPAFLAASKESDTLTTAADAKWDAYGLGSCGTDFGSA
jgi:hypothetical protein